MIKTVIKYKKNITIVFIVVLSFLFTAFRFGEDSVLATVGTHKIYINDFIKRYEEYLFSTGIKDNIVTRRSILNNMINEILLYYYDDNTEIFNNPEYLKELEWARKQTILAFLKDREVYAKITATEEELRDAFLKTNQKVAARHLFAFTDEEADSLYNLLKKGASFDSLAKQIFTDSVLANNGGYLGYFSWGDMDPAFEDAAYNMKIGEISKPIKTKYGYSIIKVENKVTHPLLTEWEFQKKKTHMQQVIRLRKKRSAEIDFLNKTVDMNKIYVDEQNLKTLFARLIDKKDIENISSKKNHTCAKYKNKIYTLSEIEKRINEIPKFHRDKIISIDLLKTVVIGIVAQDVLYDLAVEKGYDKELEVLSTIEKYNKNIFLKYKREEIHRKYSFPDSVVYDFYKNNPIYFTSEPQYKIQKIIVTDKKLADSLMYLIKNGEDFGKLTREYSLSEFSGDSNGVFNFANLSQYGMLKDHLQKSQTGEVIGPIRIDKYYGIFKLLEKKVGNLEPFEKVYDLAHRLLKKEKSKFIVQTYIDNLKKKVDISYDEFQLSKAILNN